MDNQMTVSLIQDRIITMRILITTQKIKKRFVVVLMKLIRASRYFLDAFSIKNESKYLRENNIKIHHIC